MNGKRFFWDSRFAGWLETRVENLAEWMNRKRYPIDYSKWGEGLVNVTEPKNNTHRKDVSWMISADPDQYEHRLHQTSLQDVSPPLKKKAEPNIDVEVKTSKKPRKQPAKKTSQKSN